MADSPLERSISSASTTELEAARAAKAFDLDMDPMQDILDDLEEKDSTDGDMPSPKSISVTMDEYVSASIVGRASYAAGDILSAVNQFNEALGIELQTELECMYDTNLGFVSGLVRREVDSRLENTPRHHQRKERGCDKILVQLSEVYRRASDGSEIQPSKAKWYLRMGAALCIVNEWEKAKQVYKEGINMCKDKKDLKKALKSLTQLEQITSAAEMPPEDHGVRENSLSPASPARVLPAGSSSPVSGRYTPSPRMERRRSRPKLRKRSKSLSSNSSKQKNRRRSDSLDTNDSVDSGVGKPNNLTSTLKAQARLSRVSSSDTPSSSKLVVPEPQRKVSDLATQSPLAASDGLITLRSKKDKSFALNLLNGAKRYSLGGLLSSLGRHHPTPTLSGQEKEEWMECFRPETCPVASYQTVTSSAIVHMRKLGIESTRRKSAHRNSLSGGSHDDRRDGEREEGGELEKSERRMTFNAVKFTSMKIDSDDSELDD